MKVLFYFFILFLNIFFFRYVIYIDDFVKQSIYAYFAVFLYLLSEAIRTFNYTRDLRQSFLQTFIIQAFCGPTLLYITDIIHIIRFKNKGMNYLNHFLSARFFDLLLIFLFLIFSRVELLGFYLVFFIGIITYLISILIYFTDKIKELFDFRNFLYSFMTMSLFFMAYNLFEYNLSERADFVNIIPFYFPIISNNMRLGIFAHFLMSIFLVSFQSSRSENE